MFKSSVLGDPRILLLGSTFKEEAIGQRKNSEDANDIENAAIVHQFQRIDTET